jgi:hypothetical protein
MKGAEPTVDGVNGPKIPVVNREDSSKPGDQPDCT